MTDILSKEDFEKTVSQLDPACKELLNKHMAAREKLAHENGWKDGLAWLTKWNKIPQSG